MPTLWGRQYPKVELLRHVGRLDQVAGVRLAMLGDGAARGVRVLEFRTGTGFSFDVLIDRTFDIGRCEQAGRSLAWISNVGVSGPWYAEHEDWSWFRSWGGGMVVTCGLDHTMNPASDDASQFSQPHMLTSNRYPLHGRVGGLPARLVGYGERWDGDECVLWAEGEVLQATVFGEHLQLRRRIEAHVGESRFTVHDEVENVGHSRTSHMLLYHCNAGFPVVDEGSELLIPAVQVTTDPWASIEDYRTLSGPTPDFQEACFYHEVADEPDGRVPVAIVNRRLGLGLYQVFDKGQLPHFMVWRMMGEDTYAVALEPGTDRAVSRTELSDSGELTWLAPGERRTYDLELGALDGLDDIDAFAARVRAASSAPGQTALRKSSL